MRFNGLIQKEKFKKDFTGIACALKQLDKKVSIIFLSIAVLQIISWYYTSRNFFHENIYYQYFADNPDADLYEYLFWFAGDFITLLVIPLLIIKLFFREKISNYGFKFGDLTFGLPISIVFIVVMFVIIWFASASEDFTSQYPLLNLTKYNWTIFGLFEVSLFIYIIAWEFIWRGYMLFGLEEKFGYYAVFIQMIPFVILHNGKPVAETFGAIAGAIILGMLALRTRSFYYGVIIHFVTVFFTDLISILRYQFNDYGVGFSSFFNMISKIF